MTVSSFSPPRIPLSFACATSNCCWLTSHSVTRDTSGSIIALYAAAVLRFGRVSTMIERDDRIPPLSALIDELAEVRDIAERQLCGQVA